MNTRPILFSGPMVRAILEGRKTQTRRIIKDGFEFDYEEGWPMAQDEDGLWMRVGCPFGEPADQLWVRETWRRVGGKPDSECTGPQDAMFHATASEAEHAIFKWKPCIHMPRWASRITLRVTGVRVERLQEISQADSVAEGMPANTGPFVHHTIADFRRLWGEINGPKSWDTNPWVWVVSFERITPTSSGDGRP